MAEVGAAFVSVLPSGRGFGSRLSKEIDPQLDAAGKRGGSRFGGAFKSAVGPLLAGLGVVALGGFLKGAVADASDLSEAASKVNVVFGDQAGAIFKASKTSATAMGLTKAAYLEATGSLGNLLVSLDIAPKKAAGMSQQMVKLAGDLASFNNVSPEEALQAIQSGLTGETEPLKRFGVNMNDATLKAQALKLGLIKTTKEAMTPQTKALAAQALIMAQTKTAQGDFARTSGGLANQQRILAAQFGNMKATVGAALLPILTKLAVFVNNQLLPGITNFASGVRSAGDFVRSNSTTFKILAAVLAAAVLPTVVAVTFAFIAQLASTVALTAAWLAYALVVNAMSIATKVAAATQWLLNVAMSANPIALIVIAIIGLIAIIVLVATKTKFFQTIWKAAMGFITNAAQAVFGWLKRNWPLLLAIITGPIGLAVLFIVRHWSQIKSATSSLVSAVIGFFSRLGSGVRDKIGDAVAFAKAMPGKIKDAVGNLGSTLLNAGKELIGGLIKGITSKFGDVKNTLGNLTGKLTSWKGPESLDRVILQKSGRLVIDGFITGLESRYDNVQSSLGGLTSSLNSSVALPAGARLSDGPAAAGGSGASVTQIINPSVQQSEAEIGRTSANRLLWALEAAG